MKSCRLVIALNLFAVLLAPANAMEDDRVYYFAGGEVDIADSDEGTLFTWEVDAWAGGDRNKLWIESEGEMVDGEVEESEIQILYSRNISQFWDLRTGIRNDQEPGKTSYFVLGVEGLMPYRFETDAKIFVSEEGDVSFRLEQEFDLQITQRLVAKPYFEVEAFASDVNDRNIGAGFSDLETGLQFRYEVTRKFAPYLDLAYERKLGETANIVKRNGHDTEEFTTRFGVKFWF